MHYATDGDVQIGTLAFAARICVTVCMMQQLTF